MQKPKISCVYLFKFRITGQQKGFCHSKDSVAVIQKFMEEIEGRELGGEIMITNTGCMGICSMGPVVVVYRRCLVREVTVDDVEEIVEEHLETAE
jgi:(2Fe-2S) ferredoxin